jgi:hypothetical protein
MRLVAVADVLDKRESNCEKDALLDADRGHRHCGEKRQEEFAWAFAPSVAETLHIDHADRDRENDARQHAVRQVFNGPVRNKSTKSTTAAKASCATWLRAPASSAMAVCVGLPLTTKAR